ncbi:MAG: right-handed parallel beta-helix repeat-containing protein, partial [Phycisphaeraceae bacterium]|nr:right-handed parallel beta-helix repeat-containing protein [Phycisphaeraceae bacterium]
MRSTEFGTANRSDGSPVDSESRPMVFFASRLATLWGHWRGRVFRHRQIMATPAYPAWRGLEPLEPRLLLSVTPGLLDPDLDPLLNPDPYTTTIQQAEAPELFFGELSTPRLQANSSDLEVTIGQGDIAYFDLRDLGAAFQAVAFNELIGGRAFLINGQQPTQPLVTFNGQFLVAPNLDFLGQISGVVRIDGFDHHWTVDVGTGFATGDDPSAVPVGQPLPSGFSEATLRTQQRLAYLGFPDASGNPLAVSGSINNPTRHAIGLFNAASTPPYHAPTAGNLVVAAINDPGAPRWLQLQDSPGVVIQPSSATHRHATSYAADVLASAGQSWLEHPDYNGTDLRMLGASPPQGGANSLYRTHEAGMDIDISTRMPGTLASPFFATITLSGQQYVAGAAGTVVVHLGDGTYGTEDPNALGFDISTALRAADAWDQEAVLAAIADLIVDAPGYSLAQVRGMLAGFSSQVDNPLDSGASVQRILYNDPRTWDMPGVRFAPGHSNHFHVDVMAPSQIVSAAYMQQLLGGVDALAGAMAELSNTQLLQTTLPLLPFGLGEFLDIESVIRDEVLGRLEALFSGQSVYSIADIQQALADLGTDQPGLTISLVPGSLAVSYDRDQDRDELRIDLALRVERTGHVPLRFESVGMLSGDDSQTVLLTAGLDLDLSFGLDLLILDQSHSGSQPSASLANRFFVRIHELSAHGQMDAQWSQIEARIGLLGVTTTNGSVDIDAQVAASWLGPEPGGKDYISLADLAGPAFTSQFAMTGGGSVAGQFTVQGGFGGYQSGAVPVSFSSSDAFDPDALVVDTGAGWSELGTFSRMDADALLAALDALTHWFDQLDASTLLNIQLPVAANVKLSDLAAFGQNMRDAVMDKLVDENGQALFNSIQQFEQVLADALGISTGALGLNYDAAARTFSWTMALHPAIETSSAPIDFGLSEQGFMLFNPAMAATMNAQQSMSMTVGIDLSQKTVELIGNSPLPANGVLNEDIVLLLSLDFDEPVTVVILANPGNTTRNQLIADINAALVASGLGGEVQAGLTSEQHLKLEVVTPGDTYLQVFLDTDNPAAAQLGLADGQLAGIDTNERIFFENMQLGAEASLSLDQIYTLARLGFLDLQVNDGNAAAQVSAMLRLKDTQTGVPGGRATLKDVQTAGLFGLPGLFDVEVNGSLSVHLDPMVVSSNLASTPVGNLSINIDWSDVLDPGTLDIQFSQNFDELQSLVGLSAQTVLASLQEVRKVLVSIQSSPAFSQPLSLVNSSLGQLMNLTGRIDAIIAQLQLEADPPVSVQDLLDRLEGASLSLGGVTGELGIVTPGLGFGFADNILSFSLGQMFTGGGTYQLGVDLSSLGIAGLGEILAVDASTGLTIQAEAGFLLDFQIDLSGGTPQFFISDQSMAYAGFAALAQEMDFTVALGPLGVFIRDGSASIHGGTPGSLAGATVALNSVVGGRYNLASWNASAVNAGFTGTARATLPVYFPTSGTPFGGAAPANHIDITINLANGQTQVTAPDLQSAIGDLDLLENLGSLVLNWSGLWQALNVAIDNAAAAREIPLVGSALGDALDFARTIRDAAKSHLDELPNFAVANVQNALFSAFGPDGINILRDTNSDGQITPDDVIINSGSDWVQLDMWLGRNMTLAEAELAFDLALPIVGLEVLGGVQVAVAWDWRLGLGVDQQGIYLDTSTSNELSAEFQITLPDLEARAFLGFLEGQIRDNGSIVSGNILIDFVGGVGQRLRLPQIPSGISPTAAFNAAINLELSTGFSGAAVLPRIYADLLLDWSMVGGVHGSPSLRFENVQLSLGSFLGDFIRPIVQRINQITEPIRPILDFLYSPIPGIGDALQFTGSPPTWMDAIAFAGGIDTSFFDAIYALVSLPNRIPIVGDDVRIDLGAVNFSGNLMQSGSSLMDLANLNPASFDYDDLPSNTHNFFNEVRQLGGHSYGFSMPILEDPGEALLLLLGGDPRLFEFRLPSLEWSNVWEIPLFDFDIPIPAFPLLTVGGGVSVNIMLGLGFDLAFGYDTRGLRSFRETGNVQDIFIKGFYFEDMRAYATASVSLFAYISAGIGFVPSGSPFGLGTKVRVGIEAGIGAVISVIPNICTDGRAYLDQFLTKLEAGPGAAFAFTGDLVVSFGYKVQNKTCVILCSPWWTIASGTLADYTKNIFTFALDPEPPDRLENNNTRDQAAFLGVAPGVHLRGVSVGGDDPTDFYAVQVHRADTLEFLATFDYCPLKPNEVVDLYIYDAMGNPVGFLTAGNDFRKVLLGVSPGTYYIEVRGRDTRTPYSLNIMPARTSSTRVFFVNSPTAAEPRIASIYTLAPGNPDQSGLNPLSPVPTVGHIFERYAVGPDDIIVVDTGDVSSLGRSTALPGDSGFILAGSALGSTIGGVDLFSATNVLFYLLGITTPSGQAGIHIADAHGAPENITLQHININAGSHGLRIDGGQGHLVTQSNVAAQGVGIEMLNLDGRVDIVHSTIAGGAAISLGGASSHLIQHNTINGGGTGGVLLHSGNTSNVQILSNAINTASTGISIIGGDNHVIQFNTITSTGDYGVRINDAHLIVTRDNQITALSGTGIALTGAVSSPILDNQIIAQTGVNITTGTTTVIRDNFIQATGTGAVVSAPGLVLIQENQFTSPGTQSVGIHLAPTAATTSILDNFLVGDSGGIGIRVQPGVTTNIVDNTIHRYLTGIELQGTEPTLIQSNTIALGGSKGIHLTALEAETIVLDNTIANRGRGIELDSTLATILRNTFQNNGAGAWGRMVIGPTNRGSDRNIFDGNSIGIHLQNYTGLQSIVRYNIVRDGGTGIINDQPTALIIGNVIEGNQTGVDAVGILGPNDWATDRHNDIRNNTVGVLARANLEVRFNRIYNNQTGIRAANGASIHHNVIYDQTAHGVLVQNAQNVTLRNNTIFSNNGNGITLRDLSRNVSLRNNIIYINGEGAGLHVETDSQPGLDTDYNNFFTASGAALIWYQKPFFDIYDWKVESLFDQHSIGYTTVDPNLDDPRFINLAARNFRLQNQVSTSIAAGDPATPVGLEPTPNGGRINLGAYGGTEWAATSTAAFIRIDYPRFYVDWVADEGRLIRWWTFNVTGDVRLELVTAAGVKIQDIAVVQAQAGSHLWSPEDANLPQGGDERHRIRIVSVSDPSLSTQTREPFAVPAATQVFYVNDQSTFQDVYTTAIGNNRNTGKTPDDPKADFLAILHGYSLTANDVVFIDTGSYIQVGNAVISGNPMIGDDEGFTIQGPDVPERVARIDRANTYDFNAARVFDFNDGDFVTVRNLWLENAQHGILIQNNSTNLRFENLVIQGHSLDGIRLEAASENTVVSDSIIRDNARYGVYAERSLDLIETSTFLRNAATGIHLVQGGTTRVEGNTVSQSNLGIYADSTGAAGRTIIGGDHPELGRGNIVHNNATHGISAGTNVLVAGNVIYDHNSPGRRGIWLRNNADAYANVVFDNHDGIHAAGTQHLIQANRVYSNNRGIFLNTAGDVRENVVYSNNIGIELIAWFRGTVANNLIYANNQASLLVGIINGSNQSTVREITNNTIVASGHDAVRIMTSQNTRLLNNIIQVEGGHGIYVSTDSQAGFRSDYNLFHVPGTGHVGYWNGQSRTSLAAWRNSAFTDGSSLARDPLFVNPAGADGILGAVPGVTDGRDDNFHLMSTAGSHRNAALAPVRDLTTGRAVWLTPAIIADDRSSPGVDRGHPGSPFALEPDYNGGFINLGAYGNTHLASLSPEPYLFVMSPDGMEVWPANQTFAIQWRSDDMLGNSAAGDTAAYRAAVLADNPSLYFSLNDPTPTAFDLAPAGGTNNANYIGTAAPGAIGALAGDGSTFFAGATNSYVELTATDAGSFIGSMSASLWFKVESFSQAWTSLFAKGSTNNLTHRLRVGNTGALEFATREQGGDLQVVQTGGGLVETHRWYHVAVVVDRTTGRVAIYLNGDLVAEDDDFTTAPATTNSQRLRIGHGHDGGNGLHGWIDEIAFFDRALTEPELAAQLQAGTPRVDIVLRRDGQAEPVAIIAQNLLNTGRHDWRIPMDLPEATDYRVEIIRSGVLSAQSTDPFEITGPINIYYINDDTFLPGDWTTAPGDDANDGLSPDRPMASIRALLERYDLGPGDIIRIDAGYYPLSANIVIAAEDAGVTLQGYSNPDEPGRITVIDRLNRSSSAFRVFDIQASDVTLSNLHITGGFYGIFASDNWGAHNVRIVDSVIHENRDRGIDVRPGNNGWIIEG